MSQGMVRTMALTKYIPVLAIAGMIATPTDAQEVSWGVYDFPPYYEVIEGVVVSKLENPALFGDWETAGLDYFNCDIATYPMSTQRCYYGNLGRGVVASAPVMLERGSHTLTAPGTFDEMSLRSEVGWVLYDIPQEMIDADEWQDTFMPFQSTAVSLPNDSASVGFELVYIDAWTGDVISTAADIEMQLHPEVIVLPVSVHVFADDNGTTSLGPLGSDLLSEGMMRNYYDPGAVVLKSITMANGGAVQQYTFEDRGENGVDLDLLWSQCNIQFSLVEYVAHFQGLELEQSLARDDECTPSGYEPFCNTAFHDGSRLSEYMHGYTGETFWPSGVAGIPVLYGGEICASRGDVHGFTCVPDSCGARGSDFIALPADDYFSTPSSDRRKTLAHEMGHYLGLKHPSETRCEGVLHDDDNLMTPGSPIASQVLLTDSQCALARCVACERLAQFGLASPNGACAAVEPTCEAFY